MAAVTGIDIEEIAPPTLADCGRYEIRHELWRHGSMPGDVTEMHQAYTPDGAYIADIDTAEYLCGNDWKLVKRHYDLPGWGYSGWRRLLSVPHPGRRRSLGIAPELRTPSSNVCTIGYSERSGEWYGWSHRAIAGFGEGYVVNEEEAAGWAERYARVGLGFRADTLVEARMLAEAFAQWVS